MYRVGGDKYYTVWYTPWYYVCMARKTKFKSLQVHEKTHARVVARAHKKKLSVDAFISKLLQLV